MFAEEEEEEEEEEAPPPPPKAKKSPAKGPNKQFQGSSNKAASVRKKTKTKLSSTLYVLILLYISPHAPIHASAYCYRDSSRTLVYEAHTAPNPKRIPRTHTLVV